MNCASVVTATALRSSRPISCVAAGSVDLTNSLVTTTMECAFCGFCWRPVRLNWETTLAG